MNQRRTMVLIGAVLVAALSAILIYSFLNTKQTSYHRKTVDGVECLVDGTGKVASCNWGQR